MGGGHTEYLPPDQSGSEPSCASLIFNMRQSGYELDRLPRLDPRWIEPFSNTVKVVDRARRLADQPFLLETQRVAVHQLLREHDRLQKGIDSALGDDE